MDTTIEEAVKMRFLDGKDYECQDVALIDALEVGILCLSKYPSATSRLLRALADAYLWNHKENLKLHSEGKVEANG